MTASYGYVITSGVVTYDTSTLLADVQAEYAVALGSSIDTDASTPQGSLMQGETLTRTMTMKNNADMANMINPDQAYGVALDAICAFLGITRGVNTATVVTGVVVTGVPLTTTITANSRVETAAGDVFYVASDVEIPASGTATVTLYSQAYGNIPAAVGTLEIIDGIVNWGSATITASSVVTPGTTKRTDPQLKIKRKQQLAVQGRGHTGSIRGNILDVSGVIDCNVVENNTGVVKTVNGVPFTLPNAVWVCVAGLTDTNQQAVINAAWLAHGGGCPWDYGQAGTGNPVGSPDGIGAVDPASGYTYNVKVTTAILHDVYVNITVKQGTSTASLTTAIQAAMVEYASGQEDSEDGLLIGTSVSAFEMAGAAIRQVPGIYVKTCSVAAVPAGDPAPGPGAFTSEVLMNPWDLAQLSLASVNVTVTA